ncbi:DUF4132 domain-containing protein [Paenibacillaceae bacterium]|nr:DUF4132 domain-containing protein [Paenibacillaceae bacterium]
MLLKKSEDHSLVGKFLAKLKLEAGISEELKEITGQYITGACDTFPGVPGNSVKYVYTLLHIFPEMRRIDENMFFRAAAVLFAMATSGHSRNQILEMCLGNDLEPFGLGTSILEPGELETKRLHLIGLTNKHLGEDGIAKDLETNLKLRGPHSSISDIVSMMLMVRYMELDKQGYIEQVKAKLAPIMYHALTGDYTGLRQEAERFAEEIVMSPLPIKEHTSRKQLESTFLDVRRDAARAEYVAQGKELRSATMTAADYKEKMTLLSAVFLYKLNVHGGKASLLNTPDEGDGALLQALRTIYAVDPIHVIHNLLWLDNHRTHEMRFLELLGDFIPFDEPYELIILMMAEFSGYSVHWEELDRNMLADPARALRTAEIAADPLVKGFVYKLLDSSGHLVPDVNLRLEQLALSLFQSSSKSRNMYRYLTGELTFPQLQEAESEASKRGWGLERAGEVHLMLFAFLEPSTPLFRRFFVLLSHVAEPYLQENLLRRLYITRCFDGLDAMSRYADDPEVNERQFLLAALKLGDSDYNRSVSAEQFYGFISGNAAQCLDMYKDLSLWVRTEVLKTLYAAKDELPQEHYNRAVQLGLGDTSKAAAAVAQAEFAASRDRSLYIQLYRNEKKAKVKELVLEAIRSLEDHEAIYRELLEQEKNAKFKQLIQQLLDAKDAPPAEAHAALGSAADKKQLARLNWLDMERLPLLADQQGNALASEIKIFMLTQSFEFGTAPNPLVLQVSEYADPRSLADFSMAVLEQWLDNKAPAKERWVLFLAAVLGGNRLTERLSAQIEQWADSSRGAIAADAVRALAFTGELSALMRIDTFTRTVKNKQVRGAAVEALMVAADNMNMSTAELEDKLVPTLGFDGDGKRQFNYGERAFTVKVNNELELAVTNDETGKQVKSLPAPGRLDNEALAAAAKAEFAQLKKDLKRLITVQSLRLEDSLSRQRLWSAASWKSLFVGNMLMQKFAIGLIWGAYSNGELQETFRYMEDGTFNTVDEEEYELEEATMIGLIHPLELDASAVQNWVGQLDDYEIVQPFPQLARTVYVPTEEQAKGVAVEDIPNHELSPSTLIRVMEKYGWEKGGAMDGGWFHEFYKEYGDIIAELKFSGTSIVYYEGQEQVELEKLVFYSNRSVSAYYRDEQRLKIAQVAPRIYSEAVYDVMRAAGK